jgi:hypothetical protein
VVLLELQVVEAPAGEVDRAGQRTGRFDLDALRGSEGGGAIGKSLRHAIVHNRSRRRRLAVHRRGIERGIGSKLFLLLDLDAALRLLELRTGDQELPSEEDNHAQHDGEDHVPVVVVHLHYFGFRGPSALLAWTFAIEEERSCTSLSNASPSASRRPTST